MMFPVAHSSQIEIFAKIHFPVFEQSHIFHLSPGRGCCPGGAGSNTRMAGQSWALGWGFAKPSLSLAQSSRVGDQQSQNLPLGSLQELPGTSQGLQ